MKCIRCAHDSKYPERAGGLCPKCRGRFAFEPRKGDPFSDAAFEAMIAKVSGQGRIRWGVEHLYYEACRRLNKKPPVGRVVASVAVFMAAGFVASLVLHGLGGLVGVAAGAAWYWLRPPVPLAPMRPDAIAALFIRWKSAHGSPQGLITRPEGGPPGAELDEEDLGDYSFDRAVICDRPRTVDLLLANNFHFENNCAVLTADGYPAFRHATIRAMLRRNPRLAVFVLHDATPAGCALAARLARDRSWFAPGARIVDVGLRPGQAARFRGLWQPPQPGQPDPAATEAERRWLGEYALELAAIRPEQVIKRLFRAMGRTEEGGGGDLGEGGSDGDGGWGGTPGGGQARDGDGGGHGIGGVHHDAASFSSDADASDGGGDSFG